MTPPQLLRQVVSARVYGTVAVPLSLEYRLADPVAIKLTLGTCTHRRSWHVARDVIAAGLMGGDEVTDQVDGDVSIQPLPGNDSVLIGLRARPVYWLVSVPAAELERFFEATLRACPPEREAQLVGAELDVAVRLFSRTPGGGNPE